MADGQAQAQQQQLIQGQSQLQVDPAVQAFQNLRVELANVTQALTAQRISRIVSRFDGNPKNFREWIKSIEKYAVLINADEDRKKFIAYQSSGGACLVLFRDTCKQMRARTWAQMKAQLAVRFSDVTDNQMALSLLR